MEIRSYSAVIRRWLWLVVLAGLIAGVVSYAVSSRMQPVYRATATIVILDTTSRVPGYDFSVSAVIAHAELARGESVMQDVITTLKLPYSTEQLRSKISTQTAMYSPFVKVSVEDADPFMAQQIANTTVAAYIQHHRASLQAAAEEFLTRIEDQINATLSQIDQLEAKRDTVGLTPEEANELEGLQDDVESLNAQRTIWNTELVEAMASAGVSIAQSASAPTSPVSPKTLQNVAVACILGLALTTGGVFLKEYLYRSVKTAEDVSLLTGLSTLGTIPKFKTTAGLEDGLIAAENPRSSVAEAFRMLRTNLQFATLDTPAQTLMIASAGPAEGKTSVLANLAVVLAQTGKTVIVVDTDMRHSTLHEIFDAPNNVGFSSLLLAQQPNVKAYLKTSKIADLKVLPAGPSPGNPGDLIASSRVPMLIESLKKQAEVILFDSAPVLAAADAAILAPKVDAVILLVSAGHTKPEALVETASILSKGNARVLGVVLNRARNEPGALYHYHYRDLDYYGEDHTNNGRNRRRRLLSGQKAIRGFLRRFRRE